MTPEKLSALFSILAALAIVLAAFFQWWSIGFNGQMFMRTWVKVLLGAVILLLVAAAGLLFS